MIFKLSQLYYWVDKEEKEQLEKLGFKFKKTGKKYRSHGEFEVGSNENLTIEISTLEELVSFVKKYGKIVLYEDEIEIYNNYRE